MIPKKRPGGSSDSAQEETGGADEIKNTTIGPLAKSTASYLRYEIGISYRKVQRILDDLFGLSCVPASLVGFDRRAAKRGKPLYEDVREKIRASDVVHADETFWRNDGVGHYVWIRLSRGILVSQRGLNCYCPVACLPRQMRRGLNCYKFNCILLTIRIFLISKSKSGHTILTLGSRSN